MKISLIAALSQNRAIGKGNQLIWKIPEDLKRFREITSGHPVVMGRKTFESIGRLLPNRANIIITRDSSFVIQGALIVHSLEEAIEVAISTPGESWLRKTQPATPGVTQEKEEIFIIGGGQVFEQAIKIADKLYLTIIEKEFEGDTFFPDYSSFKKISESPVHEYQGVKYKFVELEK